MDRAVPGLELKDPAPKTISLGIFLGKKMIKWPNVNIRPMSGLFAFYRNEEIFAALPHSKAMGLENAVNFKLISRDNIRSAKTDPLVISDGNRSDWFSFILDSEKELPHAFDWLIRAYKDAGIKNNF